MKYIDKYQGSEVSFWEVFPYMKETGLFKTLYKADRSKDKNKSSKVMWYLALLKDIDSEFYTLEKDDQYGIITDTVDLDVLKYLGSKEELDLYEKYFEEFIDTAITADIRSMEAKLVERKQFIKDTPYSLDEMVYPDIEAGETFKPYKKQGTAAQLDKMIVDTKNIHEEIRKLREAARSEQTEKGKGGRESSFLEG